MSVEESRSLLDRAREIAQQEQEKTKKKTTKNRSTSRKKAAPVAVEPGWIHYQIAARILRKFQDKFGTELDVGLPEPEIEESTTEEQREPLEIAARIVAHMMHRIPFLRNVGKRMEGKEKRSGVLSDIGALVWQLYVRNEEVIPQVWARAKAQAQAQRMAAEAKRKEANGVVSGVVGTSPEGRVIR